MKKPLPKNFIELYKLLKEGKMLKHPMIKRHVNYALTTGDCSPLYNYLQDFPKFTAIAQRNIKLAEVNKLNNPYPLPDMQETEECLSGSILLGKVTVACLGFIPMNSALRRWLWGNPGLVKVCLTNLW
jgi:hypothetical protein